MPRVIAAALAPVVLAACAPLQIERNQSEAESFARERFGAELRLLATPEMQARARAEVERTLEQPLAADDAVRVALSYSASLQAMLFESAAASAAATQSARLPNPILALERLARREDGARALELGRAISFSLIDLLLLPARRELADARQRTLRLNSAADVVRTATAARQAGVRAVAARQSEAYFADVLRLAEVGAELARRMESAGNFSRLQRVREQAFYAEAVAQLARARQAERSTREALVRALGLEGGLAQRLRLPERLPDLPQAPMSQVEVADGFDARLDVRLARSRVESMAGVVNIAPPGRSRFPVTMLTTLTSHRLRPPKA
ncbi:MAG: TolC family protein [Burkholderiales bacterium]|nr:MAG: TolC family protein [Burkholderiales bacterium]